MKKIAVLLAILMVIPASSSFAQQRRTQKKSHTPPKTVSARPRPSAKKIEPTRLELSYSEYAIVEDGSGGKLYKYSLTATVYPENITDPIGFKFASTQGIQFLKMNPTHNSCTFEYCGKCASSIPQEIIITAGDFEATCKIIVQENPAQCMYLKLNKKDIQVDKQLSFDEGGFSHFDKVEYYPKALANGCNCKLHFTAPITSIPGRAFYQNSKIQKVVFPKDLKKIGSTAFAQCKNLTEVVFNEGLEEIGPFAFYADKKSDYGIKQLNFPSTLKSIGESAFEDCRCSKITIPASVTFMGFKAFWDSGDTIITFEGKTPPSSQKPAGEEFYRQFLTNRTKVYVPSEAFDTYKKSEYFKHYANNIKTVVHR